MAWYDRDYYRDSYRTSQFGRLSAWSITTWLIVINVSVFLLDGILAAPGYIGPLFYWGYFSAATAIYDLQIWRFLTFQFLHGGLGHLFFNMLALYFFGPMIESYLGRRRFLAFYLLCGVAGALTYLLLWWLHILIAYAWVPLVGASAGIFGILVASAKLAPDTQVMLLFPPIPLRLRTMALILLGIAAATIVLGGPNAGGQAAHLGGALLGLALIVNPRWLNVFDGLSLRTWRLRRQQRRWYHDYR